jgi:NAD dependent epimerase/dehydratase family enzyme
VNIGITGASGFLGRAVIDLALRRGHEVIAFSRQAGRGIPGCESRAFSLEQPPDVTGCEAILHLAGEPVLGYWTPAKKRRIRESRVQGTRRIAEAIRSAASKPEVFVSASGVGIYGNAGEQELTESAPLATTFLAQTARDWETEAFAVEAITRVVTLRTGMAMLALWSIENQDVQGPVNAVAPWPVRNAELTTALAKAVRRPAIFAAPAWALRLIGGLSDELLESRRALPARAAEWGFRFQFPELNSALKDLLP